MIKRLKKVFTASKWKDEATAARVIAGAIGQNGPQILVWLRETADRSLVIVHPVAEDVDIGWSITRGSTIPTHPKIATIELPRHSGRRGYFIWRAFPGESTRARR